jgi:hypothetical protein
MVTCTQTKIRFYFATLQGAIIIQEKYIEVILRSILKNEGKCWNMV